MKTTILAMFLSLSALGTGIAYAADAPAGMKDVAVCKDGKTYSNATGEHRGACRGHGGVAKWSDGSAVKSRKGTSSYR